MSLSSHLIWKRTDISVFMANNSAISNKFNRRKNSIGAQKILKSVSLGVGHKKYYCKWVVQTPVSHGRPQTVLTDLWFVR